jgi:hypothetical protein
MSDAVPIRGAHLSAFVNSKRRITHAKMGNIIKQERNMIGHKTFWTPKDAGCAVLPERRCREEE